MVEPLNVSDGVKQVTNTYDYLGRRVRKMTEVYNASTPAYEVESNVRFVYDGWNVVLELDGLLEELVHKKYTWGLDLSNSLQGAGGVGGLLACHDTRRTWSTGDDVDYLYQYDGNGNVVALLNSANGNVLKQYDFDPYGNALAPFTLDVVLVGNETGNNAYRLTSQISTGRTFSANHRASCCCAAR